MREVCSYFQRAVGRKEDEQTANTDHILFWFWFLLAAICAPKLGSTLQYAASGIYREKLSTSPYLVTLTEKAERHSVLDIIQTY